MYKEEYKRWLSNVDDEGLLTELKAMSDVDIKESFYRNLEFGTGGLRGILGAGTNRMNIYVIRRATQGLADYILKMGEDYKKRGVVIAFDSRNFSKEFADSAARVLCQNGIKVYLFDSLRPTPELSFSVRYFNAAAGIVITASHNPAEYNGYKVYGEDGAQISPEVADMIIEYINNRDFFGIELADKNSPLLNIIGKEVDEKYIDSVAAQTVNYDLPAKESIKIVYTPLHGSGNLLVRATLKKLGYKNVIVVKEQEMPDGNFPTVKSPNPENKECFTRAIELAKENDASLIIGTDPDSDRVGIVVRNSEGDYVTMTGNQVGAMLVNYILSAKKERGTLPQNGAVVSTIVSTKMGKTIADAFGIKFFETLTGFKFIGEKIYEFERDNSYEFLLGYEESYGYLVGTYARDKDAVVASMLICEMAAYYGQKGLTLYDVMQSLYEKYGAFSEELESITLGGSEGMAKIQKMMCTFREACPDTMGGLKVEAIRDYKTGIRTCIKCGKTQKLDLPKSDVLYFELENNISFVVRPSGTEPKIKIYFLASADSKEKADEIIKILKADVDSFLEKI